MPYTAVYLASLNSVSQRAIRSFLVHFYSPDGSIITIVTPFAFSAIHHAVLQEALLL